MEKNRLDASPIRPHRECCSWSSMLFWGKRVRFTALLEIWFNDLSFLF